MKKQLKINYVNTKKIKKMKTTKEKIKVLGLTFGGLAIFFESLSIISAPNPTFATFAIGSVVGLGVCATKEKKLNKKIENYIDSH